MLCQEVVAPAGARAACPAGEARLLAVLKLLAFVDAAALPPVVSVPDAVPSVVVAVPYAVWLVALERSCRYTSAPSGRALPRRQRWPLPGA
ncbi:MAG: hypothetical protein A3H71_01195 [Candidatus Sungbacteria bacterium RIFCSPLOWO2_02_FULL_48_13b]|uniref:Uncharacterized protein n=1 Tax=Candidatus Sungbacteria bacterium RIFCSPLOWO2_02_FULL_48_13b TaxID=1802283 RepID=A0A1G2LJ08_9BACT|nr:MAG: hypothetical protein A3H71_01195 [Candidatus Sungbacteria bacterium RIFCSPLOWO2_02_FULL_48_13b]